MSINFDQLIIDVKVSDLTRAVDFYKNVLELHLIKQANDWASFEVGDAEIHLYLHGGVSDGLEFGVSKIENEVKKLKEKNVVFTTPDIMEFSWGRAAYFNDSEGNKLALVEEAKA